MNHKSLPNESVLLDQASEGSEKAFAELFYHYHHQLGRFVFKMIQSHDLAEEIVQDVFIKVWLGKKNLKAVDNFERYIYAAVRNQTYTTLKKQASEKRHALEIEKFLVNESAVDGLDSPSEHYREMIAEAISKLPPQQRKVYMMSRYDKLKYQEIADQLGLSVPTVKKHIQLAVKSIRESLKNGMDLPILLVLTSTILF